MRELLKEIRTVYEHAITEYHLAQIDAELAKPDDAVGEIVYNDGSGFNVEWSSIAIYGLKVGTKLHAHPPRQQEPLSLSLIDREYTEHFMESSVHSTSSHSFEAGVRFAERAHGIGGEK